MAVLLQLLDIVHHLLDVFTLLNQLFFARGQFIQQGQRLRRFISRDFI